ncbi:MAG: hypothetical protein WAM70_09455, partial [Pyrinomonadaceae bacterium]
LYPIQFLAQQPAQVLNDGPTVDAQDLEAVLTEAKSLTNKNAKVNITARAAMLVSYSDPARAERMLIDLWRFVLEQTDSDFDKQKSQILILKYLQSRSPQLARRLMSERSPKQKSSSPMRSLGLDDESNFDGQLARALLDTDPASAAAVLEQSLSTGISMASVGALTTLRERNFLLADYVAAKAMDAMSSQPTLISLPALNLLPAYVFPGSEAPVPSIDAESSRLSLQFRYFSVAYDVLRASLNETREGLIKEHHYTDQLLQFRGVYQAEVAAILAALAPRFQPSLALELTDIARRLAPQVPANMPRLTQSMLAQLSGDLSSQDPEQRFFFALSKPDFDEARKEIDRIREDEKRSLYTQLLLKTEARAFLARSELMEAVAAIRKLEDPTSRLVMYLDALQATQKKRDGDVAKIIINEARLLIPQTDRNGLHLRALLAFASRLMKLGVQDDGMEFLNAAITTINTLTTPTKETNAGDSLAEAAMARLNDPNTLFDEPNMEQAFAAIGQVDLEVGLAQARKIQPKPVQLLARLLTIQGVIKQNASKPKPAASPAKAAPRAESRKP